MTKKPDSSPSGPPPALQAAIDRLSERARQAKEDEILEVIEPQTSLFASAVSAPSKNRRLGLLLMELRAGQLAVDKVKQKLFMDRPPVSYDHGWVPVPLEIIAADDIGSTEKLVFQVLLRYAMKRNLAWPSQETIASHLNKSVRTIQRALVNLHQHGYIIITVRTLRGLRTYNSYTLNIRPFDTIKKKGRPNA